MSSCCQTNYNSTFDDPLAKKELNNYLKKGVKKTSQPIVKILGQIDIKNKTLLDIGGGVGVISFELFKRGLAHSTQVDFSKSYIKTFIKEAHSRFSTDKAEALLGDFTKIHKDVPNADLVTLDKVICCYPDFEKLIQRSIVKANKWYAYTLPRDIWWVKFVQSFERVIRIFKPNLVQTFVHSEAEIEMLIEAAGFKKIDQRYQREWSTVLFEKINS